MDNCPSPCGQDAFGVWTGCVLRMDRRRKWLHFFFKWAHFKMKWAHYYYIMEPFPATVHGLRHLVHECVEPVTWSGNRLCVQKAVSCPPSTLRRGNPQTKWYFMPPLLLQVEIVSRVRRYGNSTFTLKNLWAELVGEAHSASVNFSLPGRYTRGRANKEAIRFQVTCFS